MLIPDVKKKWNIKLTIADAYTGPDDKIIGQLWEYFIPSYDNPRPKHANWFQFVPKAIPDFEGFRTFGDGRDDKTELLECIKTHYQRLKRECFVDEKAKLLFSMTPVEQTF